MQEVQVRRHLAEEARKRLPLFVFLTRQFLQPPVRHEERFSIPSNRISDCRASGATRNEGWPDSPTVKRNEGIKELYDGLQVWQMRE